MLARYDRIVAAHDMLPLKPGAVQTGPDHSSRLEATLNVLVEFDAIPWQHPTGDMRFKAFRHGAQQLRLVEFSPGFADTEWCTNGHAVHVLEGALSLEMKRGGTVALREGDIAFLKAGEDDAHRASVGVDRLARLLLFELV